MNDDRLEHLLVKVVDGVATAAEREELMAHAVDHPEVRKELERQQALKALTDGWVERLAVDLATDEVEAGRGYRLVVAVGVWAVILGSVVLTFGGLFEAFVDPEVPTWLRWGLALSLGGMVLPLGAAMYHRWTTLSSDKYTEITR